MLPKSYSLRQLGSVVTLLPLQIWFLLKLIIVGSESIGFSISFITSFYLVPWFFFLVFSKEIIQIDKALLRKWVTRGILFVSVYGVVLFFLKLYMGSFIEVPYLTLNGADIGSLEEKCNMRGDLFKLISTYNNGNIFGVCMLMLMPLYAFLSRSKWTLMVLRFALILTLSRTVWVGLLLYEMFCAKSVKRGLVMIVAGLLAIILMTQFFTEDFSGFLLDGDLGGRKEMVDAIEWQLFFSGAPFSGIAEIVYLGVVEELGVIGLIFFLIAMTAPLFISFNTKQFYKSPMAQAIAKGLILYLVIACSDGTLLYIPTMVVYWFLSALLIFCALKKPVQSPDICLQGLP